MEIKTTIIPTYRPSTAVEDKHHIVSFNLDDVDPKACGDDKTLATYAVEHKKIKADMLEWEAKRAAKAKAYAEELAKHMAETKAGEVEE